MPDDVKGTGDLEMRMVELENQLKEMRAGQGSAEMGAQQTPQAATICGYCYCYCYCYCYPHICLPQPPRECIQMAADPTAGAATARGLASNYATIGRICFICQRCINECICGPCMICEICYGGGGFGGGGMRFGGLGT